MKQHIFLWLLCVTLLPATAWAQGTIAGLITDQETGDVLPGASVVIQGTAKGAAADITGRYVITDVPAGAYTLVVSFVGYKPAETTATVGTGETVVNFAMAPDYQGLEEVVVTGIASSTSRARAEIAVSRIDTEDLLDQNAFQDVSQLLNGKIAGVQVLSSSGNVGSGFRFIMRAGGGLNGDGQPVIYVDGVRVNDEQFTGFAVGGQGTSMLADINPEDIESVDVLKGPAAAALYGTSGSNGVVLIKTKRGGLSAQTSSVSVNYKSVFGVNQQANAYSEDVFISAPDANAIFRDGVIQQHSLSVSGGSSFVRYFASFDQRLEDGHIRNNDLERRSFRVNFEAFPSDKLTINASSGFTSNDINRPQNDNNIFGFLGNTLLFPNSYAFTDSTAVEALTNKVKSNRFLGSVEAIYTPLKNLKVRGSLGYDGTNIRNDESYPSNESYSGRTNGERNVLNRRVQQYTADLNATYVFAISPRLQATSIVGTQLFTRTVEENFFQKQNFSSELITNIGAGADFIAGDESFEDRREAGIFAQQEFALDNRIFFSVGLRNDFASAFGAEAPAIFYPKASMAIRLDQFARLGPFNFLKVRAAYGETGVLPGLFDGQLLLWTAEQFGAGVGAVLDFIGNTKIEPERVREIEFGIDANLLNDRIATELTYYTQKAKDSIIDFENPPSTGLTASDVPFNVGQINGWGIEASLGVTPIRTRQNQLDLNLIWNYSDNEVQDLGGAQPIFDGFDLNVIKEDLPRSTFFTPKVLGARFNDDGTYDGVELSNDRVALGVPTPTTTGSFSVNLRFLRNFNLYVLSDWARGHRIFNNTLVFARRFGNDPRYQELGALLGLREEEGITALTPGTSAYNTAAEEYARLDWRQDANMLEDADQFKIREISLQVDATSLLKNTNLVRSLSIAFAARNVFTSTKYSLPDAEVNFAGARSLTRGQDFLTLPSPRVLYVTFNLGL